MAWACLLLAALLCMARATGPAATLAPPPQHELVAAVAAEDAAIMRELRDLLVLEAPLWSVRLWLDGWDAANTSNPCQWSGVSCDEQNRVTRLSLMGPVGTHPMGGRPTASATFPVPPAVVALSRLSQLESLYLLWPGYSWRLALPPEWLLPGGFPRLDTLMLRVPVLPGSPPLPDIPPGVLSSLKHLTLEFISLHSTLPAGWGSNPRVLPSLEELTLQLSVVEGPLPPEWSQGFKNLKSLAIANLRSHGRALRWGQPREDSPAGQPAAQAAAPAPAPAAHNRLPEVWAAGFQSLETLALTGFALQGPLPDAWQQPDSFPAISDLRLFQCQLTGTLPPLIFSNHPRLRLLSMDTNELSGPLPAEWAGSQAVAIALQGNHLSGPAFPPAWVAGSMSDLRLLQISHNPGLTGTLPPSMPWPMLHTLQVDSTGVSGEIPKTWCNAPFAQGFAHLYVGNTRIHPDLPSCAKKDMPHLQVTLMSVGQTTTPWNLLPPTPTEQAGGGKGLAMAVGLATALPLCALIAAGFAGRVLWRRRLRQNMRRALEEQRLLLADQRQSHQLQQAEEGDNMHMRAAGDDEGSKASGPQQERPGPPSSLVRRTQRGRLAALLSSELGPNRARVDVVPPEQLPTVVAHRFGPAQQQQEQQRQHQEEKRWRDGGGGARRKPGGRSGGSLQLEPASRTSSVELASLLPAPNPERLDAVRAWLADATAGDIPPARTATSASQRRQLPPAPPPSRLPGSQIRPQLPSTALEFVADERGEIVELGSGSHAAVFLARLHPMGQQAAVKVYELEAGIDVLSVWREVAMMQQCQHPRVVPLLGVTLTGRLLMVATELMPKGSLKAVLRDPDLQSELRWAARGRQVALDVAEGLDHLHTQLGIMHSDLKPAKVLLSADWRACLADLGLAQVLGTSVRTAAGQGHLYAAPEQLLGQRCGLRADLYSFGLLLVSLLTQQLVEARGSLRLPRAPEDCPQDVARLIEECLSSDPQRRPTAARVLARLRATPEGT